MRSVVVLTCWLVFVQAHSSIVFNTSTPVGTQENEVCRVEGGKSWICKKDTDCSSSKAVLHEGGHLWTCSWKDKNTHIICCPPDTGPNREPYTDSLSQRVCREYQERLCKKEYVYEPPKFVTVQGPSKKTKRDFHTAVYGGNPSKPGSHPYIALVGYGEASSISWQCGGSLISETFVLSAAHCSQTPYGPARWVRLGDLDISSSTDEARPQQFEVVERVVHAGYSAPAYYNDIVLFRLDREVVFDEYVRPACLYYDLGELVGDAVATGWGRNESHGPKPSALAEVTLKFVPTDKCKKSVGTVQKYLQQGIDKDTMLCAGGSGKDTCQGDSGGPLVLAEKKANCLATQVGVTSFGPRFCGLTAVPGTYVRVAHFVPWIENVVWSNHH